MTTRSEVHRDSRSWVRLLGLATLLMSPVWVLTDVVEMLQSGFSVAQLWITLVADAAVPFVVVGLYLAQRPQVGRLGLVSATAYAASYVLYTFSAAYALGDDVANYEQLTNELGAASMVNGVVFTLAGVGFGVAVYRAAVLPRWTGISLAAGVVLVAATQGLPDLARLLAVATRDAAFAGMGWALLHARQRR